MRRNFQDLQRSHVIARHGMVCASHPLASAAGVRVLYEGGNAMDGALAAVAVQGVVDPAMTGIGGDCFCLVARDNQFVRAFNGSGRSAYGACLDDIGSQPIGLQDPAALTIPGAVEAWSQLHQHFGALPWANIFTDAIAYAEHGFAVHERVAHDWALAAPDLRTSPTASRIYLRDDGASPEPGNRWRFPELAQTLKTVASQGPDAFYRGQLAAAMLAHCRAMGGKHSAQDFADHTGDWVRPISISYGSLEIFECPPNGQGLVALMAFAILDRAKARGLLTASHPFDPDRVEWQLRAISAGYEVRDAAIADPGSSEGLTEASLDPNHVNRLVDQITAQIKARTALYAAPYTPPHRDTVYVAARDESGLSVSLINSLFNAFGSTHVVPGTGILLHSRGQSFCADPIHPNAYGPAKRPMHTIIPALAMRDNHVDTVFGVMGAHYQPQGQVHVMTAMQDCGLSPQAAQDLPRWFANPEGFVEVEATVPQDLVRELETRLGRVKVTHEPLGGSQVIRVRDGLMLGGTDPRKDGLALGF